MSSADVHATSGFYPLIKITDQLEIATYYVVVSISLCICLFWLRRRASAKKLDRVQAIDIALVLMVSSFLGARFFHVVFEEPNYYLEKPGRILEFWRGGFVWYGGALLSTLSCAFYMKWKSLDLAVWFDLFAPICALGYAFGRVACWLTGCCYGDVCVLPEAIAQAMTGQNPYLFRHPTQLYAVAWELAVVWILLRLETRSRWTSAHSGRLFAIWLALHSLGRIFMEYFRADPRGPEPFGLSQATWISLMILPIAAIWMMRSSRRE